MGREYVSSQWDEARITYLPWLADLVFVVEIRSGVDLIPLPIIVEETTRRDEEDADLSFFSAKYLHCLNSMLIRELETEDFQGWEVVRPLNDQALFFHFHCTFITRYNHLLIFVCVPKTLLNLNLPNKVGKVWSNKLIDELRACIWLCRPDASLCVSFPLQAESGQLCFGELSRTSTDSMTRSLDVWVICFQIGC